MGKHKDPPRYNIISMRISDLERKELQTIVSRNQLIISDMMRQAMAIYTSYHESKSGGMAVKN